MIKTIARQWLAGFKAWLRANKRNAVTLALAALALGYCAGSLAAAPTGQLTATWSHPTLYTDGTPIEAGRIAHTRVVWRTCDSLETVDFTGAEFTNVPYPTATHTLTGLIPGARYCVRIRTVAQNPFAESGPAEDDAVVPMPPPPPPPVIPPPSNLTLTVAVVAGMSDTPVFKLTSTGKRSAEAAGFVQVGTSCRGNVLFRYRDQSYRAVDAAAVRWWGVVPGNSVAAPCG